MECGAPFLFLYQKMSPVFVCFTIRNWRFVISFNWKNDQRNAAHLFCLHIQKSLPSISMLYLSKLGFCNFIRLENNQRSAAHQLYTVFLYFTYRSWRSVVSFNWKNDQCNAAHLFCFYIRKLSPVFLCFTFQNLRSVISFNWKNDQRSAAHLFCFYIQNSLQYFYVLPYEICVL